MQHRETLTRKRPLGALLKTKSQGYAPLPEDTFSLVSDWHHLALLNLLQTVDRQDGEDWIAARLGINVDKVQGSLQLLTRLGLVTRTEKGWERTCTRLTTAKDIPSKAIRQFHEGTLRLAIESLDYAPVEQREISSMTMAISPHRLPEAKKIIGNFRRSLAELLEDGPKTEVYHLGVTLFPISRRPRGNS